MGSDRTTPALQSGTAGDLCDWPTACREWLIAFTHIATYAEEDSV